MITFKNKCSLKGMKTLKDQSVDLIVTDPPYNIADKNKVTRKNGKFVSTEKAWGKDFKDSWNSFEEYYEWLKPFFAEMQRVLKDDGSMIVFLDRNFASTIGYLLQKDFGLIVKNKLYFEKLNPTTHAKKNNYRSCIEEAIWISKTDNPKINFISQTEMKQVFRGSNGESRSKNHFHPCQKYTWMIQPLIERHSNEGDVVLDPFAGSGSTLRIATAMNRIVIGFEKNKGFYEQACEVLFGKPKAKPVSKVESKVINEMELIRRRLIEMDKKLKSLTRLKAAA